MTNFKTSERAYTQSQPKKKSSTRPLKILSWYAIINIVVVQNTSWSTNNYHTIVCFSVVQKLELFPKMIQLIGRPIKICMSYWVASNNQITF